MRSVGGVTGDNYVKGRINVLLLGWEGRCSNEDFGGSGLRGRR